MEHLSRIVTDFFYVYSWDKRTDQVSSPPMPCLQLFARTLVRASAYEIIVPLLGRPEIELIVKEYPPSLKNRIKMVDKNESLVRKVSRYLEPISEELDLIERSTRQLMMPLNNYVRAFNCVGNFLYKLAVALEFQAEADIHGVHHLGGYLDMVKEYVEGEEARFRLEQIHGIYNIYEKPKKLDTLRLTPAVDAYALSQRVSDLFDEAEIIQLSKNRHLLGIPSKTKSAVIKIRKGIRDLLASRRHEKMLSVTKDLILTASSSVEVLKGLNSTYEILRSLKFKAYNPPLIDLSVAKYKTIREYFNPDQDTGLHLLFRR